MRILTVPRPDTRDGLEIRLTVFGPEGEPREEVVVEGRVAG